MAWLGGLNKGSRLGIEKVAKGRHGSQQNLFEDPEPEWVEVNVKGARVENMRDFGGSWPCLELVCQLRLDQSFQSIYPTAEKRFHGPLWRWY